MSLSVEALGASGDEAAGSVLDPTVQAPSSTSRRWSRDGAVWRWRTIPRKILAGPPLPKNSLMLCRTSGCRTSASATDSSRMPKPSSTRWMTYRWHACSAIAGATSSPLGFVRCLLAAAPGRLPRVQGAESFAPS
eukprot:scaffold78_cov265-Pinguiococcus_pyrenoidosus.AAC.7